MSDPAAMADAMAARSAFAGGGVRGGVRTLLRLEGAAILGLAVLGYWGMRGNWLWFFVFFLAPDLSMLGYLAGRRVGAALYNGVHSYVGPALAIGLGVAMPVPMLLYVGLIWGAHIGFDRLLGYGLKYEEGFGWTHLGAIGKAARGG